MLLAKDELEVWDVILQLVLLVFPIRLDCDWNLDDFVLQRKEYFLADVSLDDVVGHVHSLDKELLCQVLVDVPNVAGLEGS